MDLFNKGTLHFAAVCSNKIRYQLIWEQQEIRLGDLGGLPVKMKLVIKSRLHVLHEKLSALLSYIKNKIFPPLLEFTLFITIARKENGFMNNPVN